MSAGSSAVPPRLARSYTAARRHPWVLGKLGDWVIWFGPYPPAQLVVLGGGALLLIKTFAWWSWLGPVPVVMWLVSVWAVRGAKVAGRSPFAAALGLVQALSQHPAGRIGGRAARDGRPQFLTGSFVVEAGPAREAAVAQAKPVPRAAAVVRQSGPASGLAQLLSGSGSGAVQVRGL